MRATVLTVAAILPLLLIGACSGTREPLVGSAPLEHAAKFACDRLKSAAAALPLEGKFPRSALLDGGWTLVPGNDWTSGFFAGCLWNAASISRDTQLADFASHWTEALEKQQNLTSTHDIGFIMFSSFGNGVRLGGADEYTPVLLQSAKSLMTRYNPKVGCIRSWDNRKWAFPVIIDNMMNLELLFWASKHGGTPEMYAAAVSHARHTMENHFRPDGSTYHVVGYDTVTGMPVAKATHQGYADESVWARGQAWAVYGFTMAWRESREQVFLRTAERAADWYIAHLPADAVPFWDFNAPNIPNDKKDASAAAIAASALYQLSSLETDSERGRKYRESAEKIMRSLCSPAYLAEGTNSPAILNHSVGNYPKGSEIDVSLIYADYYFLEALRLGEELNTGTSRAPSHQWMPVRP